MVQSVQSKAELWMNRACLCVCMCLWMGDVFYKYRLVQFSTPRWYFVVLIHSGMLPFPYSVGMIGITWTYWSIYTLIETEDLWRSPVIPFFFYSKKSLIGQITNRAVHPSLRFNQVISLWWWNLFKCFFSLLFFRVIIFFPK